MNKYRHTYIFSLFAGLGLAVYVAVCCYILAGSANISIAAFQNLEWNFYLRMGALTLFALLLLIGKNNALFLAAFAASIIEIGYSIYKEGMTSVNMLLYTTEIVFFIALFAVFLIDLLNKRPSVLVKILGFLPCIIWIVYYGYLYKQYGFQYYTLFNYLYMGLLIGSSLCIGLWFLSGKMVMKQKVYIEPEYKQRSGNRQQQYSEPQYSRSQYSEPGYYQPQYSQPQYNEPQYDVPQDAYQNRYPQRGYYQNEPQNQQTPYYQQDFQGLQTQNFRQDLQNLQTDTQIQDPLAAETQIIGFRKSSAANDEAPTTIISDIQQAAVNIPEETKLLPTDTDISHVSAEHDAVSENTVAVSPDLEEIYDPDSVFEAPEVDPRLSALNRLYDDGLLTAEEYLAKRAILDAEKNQA